MSDSIRAAIASSGDGTPAAIDQAIRDVRQVDETLSSVIIAWAEWEVLYRVRLQVERDLRAAHDVVRSAAGGEAGAAVPAADADTADQQDGHRGPVARLVAGLRPVLDRLPPA